MSKRDSSESVSRWVRVSGMSEDQRDLLSEIPGVSVPKTEKHAAWIKRRFGGEAWRVPNNARGLPRMMGLLGAGTPPDVQRVDDLLLSGIVRPETQKRIAAHQKRALSEAFSRKATYLYAPRGSGKSLVGILWLAGMQAAFGRTARLFVCRASARLQMAEEVVRWTNLPYKILKGQTPSEEVVAELMGFGGIVIIGWETLAWWRDILMEWLGGATLSCVVGDELHTAKSADRVKCRTSEDGVRVYEDRDNLTAAAKAVFDASDWRLGMSGSPVPNRRIDLWAQLDLLEPWAWGGKTQFGLRYCAGVHNGFGYDFKGQSEDAEFRKRLSGVMTVIPQSEVRSFYPPKRRQIIRLEQSDLCEAAPGIKAEIRAAAKAARGRTEQLVGAYYEKLLEEVAGRKRDWVISQVVSDVMAGMKVTVFTGRRPDCDALGKILQTRLEKLDGKVWYSHGGVSSEARNAIRLEYMGYDPSQSVRTGARTTPIGCVNVCTGQAWGESLNLHDTDIAYFVMLPPTPKDVQQWEDRFCRMGGSRPVLICYVIVPGSIEDRQVDMLAFDKMPQVVDTVEDSEMDGWLSDVRGPQDAGSALDSILASLGKAALLTGGE